MGRQALPVICRTEMNHFLRSWARNNAILSVQEGIHPKSRTNLAKPFGKTLLVTSRKHSRSYFHMGLEITTLTTAAFRGHFVSKSGVVM